MAKKCMTAREKRRVQAADKWSRVRASLKETISSTTSSFDDKQAAISKLNKLPRDSSPSRQTTRCVSCGRPHAVYKKFGLCRICIREAVMKGWLPGVTKSSW